MRAGLKVGGKLILGKREVKLKVLMGESASHQIFLVKDTKSEERFTMISFITGEVNEGIECENQINLLKKLKNRYAAKLLFADFTPVTRDLNCYHLLYELSPTTLKLEYDAYLDSEERMTEARVLDIFEDLLNTVVILHNKYHPLFLLKLSMEYIMHTKEGYYKLYDLRDGLEQVLTISMLTPEKEAELVKKIVKNIPVSYRAPELVYLLTDRNGACQAEVTVNAAADVWQLGCLLYQLLFYRGPFDGENDDTTNSNILHYNYSYPDARDWEERERERFRRCQIIKSSVTTYFSKLKRARLTDIKQLLTYFQDVPPSSKEVTNIPPLQLLTIGECGVTTGQTRAGGMQAVTAVKRQMFSAQIHSLIDFMLEPNPAFRPTALQVMQRLCAISGRPYPAGWPFPPPPHAPTYAPKSREIFPNSPIYEQFKTAQSPIADKDPSNLKSESALATPTPTPSPPSNEEEEGEKGEVKKEADEDEVEKKKEKRKGKGGGGEGEEKGGKEKGGKSKEGEEGGGDEEEGEEDERKRRHREKKEKKKKEKEEKEKRNKEKEKKHLNDPNADLEEEVRFLRSELKKERTERETDQTRGWDREQQLQADVVALRQQVEQRNKLVAKREEELQGWLVQAELLKKSSITGTVKVEERDMTVREVAARRKEEAYRVRDAEAQQRVEEIRRLEAEFNKKKEQTQAISEEKRKAVESTRVELADRENDVKKREKVTQERETAVTQREQEVEEENSRLNEIAGVSVAAITAEDNSKDKDNNEGEGGKDYKEGKGKGSSSSQNNSRDQQLTQREQAIAEREKATLRREISTVAKENELVKSRMRYARIDYELMQREEDLDARAVALSRKELEFTDRRWKLEETMQDHLRRVSESSSSSSGSSSPSSLSPSSSLTLLPSASASSLLSSSQSHSSSSSNIKHTLSHSMSSFGNTSSKSLRLDREKDRLAGEGGDLAKNRRSVNVRVKLNLGLGNTVVDESESSESESGSSSSSSDGGDGGRGGKGKRGRKEEGKEGGKGKGGGKEKKKGNKDKRKVERERERKKTVSLFDRTSSEEDEDDGN